MDIYNLLTLRYYFTSKLDCEMIFKLYNQAATTKECNEFPEKYLNRAVEFLKKGNNYHGTLFLKKALKELNPASAEYSHANFLLNYYDFHSNK
jgi:hypothetical protein